MTQHHLHHRKGSWQFALVIGVLLVGAYLRFQHLGAIEHNIDHAYPVWQALMTLYRGVFPVTGQGTSVLFANPTLTGYLYIPFVALTRSPLGPYVFVILMNTLALALAYSASRMLLDRTRALIVTGLMAVNPWVIEYSRAIWVQSLLPFFACLLCWLLVPVLRGQARHPSRRLLVAAIALTAMTQTYLLAFVMVIPCGLLLLCFRQRIRWRAVGVGVAIFVGVTALYGLGLVRDPSTIERVQEFRSGDSRFSGEALSHAVRLVTGLDYPLVRGVEAPARDSEVRQLLTNGIHGLLAVALIAGVGGAGYHIVCRTSLRDSSLIILIWCFTPVALMSIVSRPVHPFYQLLTLPAGGLLVALATIPLQTFLQTVGPRRWNYMQIGLAMLGVAIALVNGLNTIRFAEETLATPGKHDYSAMPIFQGMRTMNTLINTGINTGIPLAQVADQDRRVVFADGDVWILNSLRGALFSVDRRPQQGDVAFYPQGGGTALTFLTTLATPSARGQVVAFADGTSIRAEPVLSASDVRAARGFTSAPIPSDRGLSFIGSDFDQPLSAGKNTTYQLYWLIESLPAGHEGWLLGAFIHLYDATGKRVAVISGPVAPGNLWRVGELQVYTLLITPPQESVGPYTLQVGQYDGVHNLGATFTLPEGNLGTIRIAVSAP